MVEASPKNSSGLPDLGEAFWMRTIPATGCQNFQPGGIPDSRQGIVYYKKGSTAYPFTPQATFNITCTDEPYNQLHPKVAWQVPKVTLPGKLMVMSTSRSRR